MTRKARQAKKLLQSFLFAQKTIVPAGSVVALTSEYPLDVEEYQQFRAMLGEALGVRVLIVLQPGQKLEVLDSAPAED